MQREFLVTKMVCAKCGENLSLSYDTPKATHYAEGEPTGAAMVQMKVAVEPCGHCMAPLTQFRAAARVLIAGDCGLGERMDNVLGEPEQPAQRSSDDATK